MDSRRRAGPPGLKPTRAGLLYILITLLLGFGAVNTGNNLLYLLVSALLAFLAVSGVAGWANLRGMEVELELPDEIYDGTETVVKVRLLNRRRRLPAFLLQVEVQGRASLLRLVEAGEGACTTAAATFHGRGRRPLPLRPAGEATVFPTPRPCRVEGTWRVRMAGENPAAPRGEEGDLRRIVDYTGAEPLRRIHWKLSARQGELKVKEMSAASGEPVILDLDRLPGAGIEERLGSCAFLVNRLVRENRPVGLRLGKRLIPPDASRGHRLRLLRELAFHGRG